MKTLVEKINTFEAGPETVSSFNSIFTNCQLREFDGSEIVTIGEICGPDTVRVINIRGENIRHNFKPVESDLNAECQENQEDQE